MKNIVIGLFFISTISFAQELKLQKATKQTTNAGASPTSTINYTIQVKKSKKCKVSIDSVVNVYTQKSSPFDVYKTDNATVLSPVQKIDVTNIKEKGLYSIHFYSIKARGSGRPGAPPMQLMVPIADFTQGAIVYYRVGKKSKNITVESFEELQTINAP